MSDLVKAQNMSQFNWYTCWTSLGANGTPDNQIKKGLKQPDWIKISFKKGAKEITCHVMPDQARFGAKNFLAYTLPIFKSMILTQLLDTQKDDGPLLFSLMGQYIQDIGLTKWTSIITKQCPNDADCTKANFSECIREYLEAVAGFPNVGNQLICWPCTAKKPTLMSMHKFMRYWVQLLSFLEGGYSFEWWKYPRCKRRVSKSSLRSPRHIKTSLQTWTRHCLPTCSRWLLSLSSVKQSTRWLAFLRRLPRTRSSQKKRKQLNFLSRAAMNQATGSILVVNIPPTIKAADATATIAGLTIVIEMIDATIVLDATTRTQRAPSPTIRRMIASAITPRKRATRPCILTSPLCQAWVIRPEELVVFIQDLCCALVMGLALALAQAAGATATTMWPKMTAGRLRPSSGDTCTPWRATTAYVSVALTRAIPFLPSSLLW